MSRKSSKKGYCGGSKNTSSTEEKSDSLPNECCELIAGIHQIVMPLSRVILSLNQNIGWELVTVHSILSVFGKLLVHA